MHDTLSLSLIGKEWFIAHDQEGAMEKVQEWLQKRGVPVERVKDLSLEQVSKRKMLVPL